jgi:hypothetical protein
VCGARAAVAARALYRPGRCELSISLVDQCRFMVEQVIDTFRLYLNPTLHPPSDVSFKATQNWENEVLADAGRHCPVLMLKAINLTVRKRFGACA